MESRGTQPGIDPPTTAQTIGRLETGTRTVSVDWLNRIAAALDVDAADLVRLPDRPDIAVAATLDAGGAQAPRRPATVAPPHAEPELVAITVSCGVGDYRTGDVIWCRRLPPAAFASALNRDVLIDLVPADMREPECTAARAQMLDLARDEAKAGGPRRTGARGPFQTEIGEELHADANTQ